ncbi:MAG: homocysteine S-methyltransferase family protein [candidate division Zixibacteria bacterium]|nr:homocysteine S-methyltransferase family protein [candidate division Zixibacteria bacterium]
MKRLLERIAAGEILVADGAMGTMLFRKGIAPGSCPELVNVSRPELLREIASEYLAAGAGIIQTNTFGGSPLKLAMYGLDGRTEEINRAAVVAVRSVVGGRAYVSGSCGPSGKILKPYGDTSPEAIYDSFLRQITCLAEAGIDVLCIETMTDISEATLAIRAAKAVSPSLPVMATMTFDKTPRGFFTIMGVDIRQAAADLANAGADVVGSNCGHGIETMLEVARQFKAASRLPLIIQSNAGLPELVDGRAEYRETPEFMAEKARQLIELDVSIIGGCCGTTPEHIAAIRSMVDRIKG